MKGILFWPISPTDEETEHAFTLFGKIINIYDYLRDEGVICGANLTYDPLDKSVKPAIAIAQIMLNDLENDPSNIGMESGFELIARGFLKTYPCE